MKPLEKLAEAHTPSGTVLALYRHDGAYLIRADGVELMTTRRHHSEDRLAESADALRDPRVRVVHDDVVRVLRAHPAMFDAIMLDTDNGPDGMLMSENARLYDLRGIALTIAACKPGGTIVYWSVGDDPAFVRALQDVGLTVTTEHARAHVTSGPFHTLYGVTVPSARPR
jgi:spermidine synthase